MKELTELTKEEYLAKTKKEQVKYINDYINSQLINFLISTTSFSIDTVKLKAKAMTPILLENITIKAITEKKGFTVIMKEMFKKAMIEVVKVDFVNVQFFLKILKIKSSSDKKEELFDYALTKLRWMSDAYTYTGKPPLLAIINDMGGIRAIQREIFSEGNLNSYAIKGFKERFMRSYDRNMQKKELLLKLISTRFPITAQVKKLDSENKEPVKLTFKKPDLRLIENITNLVMEKIK